VIGGATTLDELLACCSQDALDGLDDWSLARLTESVVAMWPRLEAARLRVIAAVDARQAFRVDGARDTASWLAWKAGERRGGARREVELAGTVAAMPAVAAGLAEGSLSKAKAAELGRVAHADADDQARLVEAAKGLPVEAVAREVDCWQLEHRPDAAEVISSVQLTPTRGGGRIDATLDAEGFEWAQLAIDSASEELGLSEVPWAQRRAQGLVGVCRYFVEHADLPIHRHGRPTVVVTLDIETLAAEAGRSARLDSGAYITGDTARRLACDAGIIRVITDPASMPLDVGRRTRTISAAQARAVIHRDRHCRYEGCTAPPWACEVHHGRFWARDQGPTDLDQLRLLCWHHHGLTHKCSDTHDLADRGDGRLRLEGRRRTTQADAA
jgi:hypothetical protein